jgi:hypothetical protein
LWIHSAKIFEFFPFDDDVASTPSADQEQKQSQPSEQAHERVHCWRRGTRGYRYFE